MWIWEIGFSLVEIVRGYSEQVFGLDEVKCKNLFDLQVVFCVFEVNYWSVLRNNC